MTNKRLSEESSFGITPTFEGNEEPAVLGSNEGEDIPRTNITELNIHKEDSTDTVKEVFYEGKETNAPGILQ